MTLRPIGRVRSPITRDQKMPPWGVAASIEVYDEFAAALHRIQKHTHLWVMAWLDGAEEVTLQRPEEVNARRPRPVVRA